MSRYWDLSRLFMRRSSQRSNGPKFTESGALFRPSYTSANCYIASCHHSNLVLHMGHCNLGTDEQVDKAYTHTRSSPYAVQCMGDEAMVHIVAYINVNSLPRHSEHPYPQRKTTQNLMYSFRVPLHRYHTAIIAVCHLKGIRHVILNKPVFLFKRPW
jgi:hypothetical protein